MYLSSPLNEWHGRKSLFYAHKNNGIKFHPDNKFGVKKEYENFQAQTLQLISNLGFTLPKLILKIPSQNLVYWTKYG